MFLISPILSVLICHLDLSGFFRFAACSRYLYRKLFSAAFTRLFLEHHFPLASFLYGECFHLLPKLHLCIGSPDPNEYLTFTRISTPLCVVSIASGYQHYLILTGNGLIYTLNETRLEQICVLDIKFSSIACGCYNSFATTRDGKVYAWGFMFSNSPTLLPFDEKVVKISAGYRDILFLTSSSTVFFYGSVEKYRGTDIACGSFHSLILSEGRVLAFGLNNYGQLGSDDPGVNQFQFENPFGKDEIVGLYAGEYHSGLKSRSGKIHVFGDNFYLQKPRLKLDNVASMSMYNQTLVVDKEGNGYCYGKNRYGKSGGRLKNIILASCSFDNLLILNF